MFGLSKYLVLITAALAALGAFTGWRWLEVREALAVERAQYREAVAGFEAQLMQIQEQEQRSREASRGYQAQLSAVQAESDALRESNRGLRLVAYRQIPAITIAPTRYVDQTPIIERDSRNAFDTGREIDISRLERLAANCQADAEQLSALIQWATR